jgi:predicted phage terminase large subunit-like protein
VQPSTKSISREWQRRSLERFVEAAWPLVASTPFVTGMHIQLICQALERLARGEITRLLITIPPRYGKTILGSVMFPAWLWMHQPGTRVLSASYALDLATRDSLAMRRLIESPWYQQLSQGRVRLVDDQAAKTRFETTAGGMRLAVSVGGAVTGEGGDLIILDDPLKIDQAHSQPAREGLIDWYASTLATRLNDPKTARMLVIAQRLHEHDLPGYLLETGEWAHVCLPVEYDPDHPHRYSADPRTTPGELLWPEKWPREEVEKLKPTLGSAATAGMLQQRPAPAMGEIFPRAAWRYYPEDAPPREFDAITQSWDLAFTDGPNADYVVGQVWGSKGANRYLLRQVRARLSAPATLDAIRGLTTWVAATYPAHATHRILVEKAANGAAIIDMLHDQIPGIIPVIPQGDKTNRAHRAVVMIESGNVYLPGAPNHTQQSYDPAHTPQWVQDLIEETARFPHTTHDDQVDALTQALIHANNTPQYGSISSPVGLPDLPHLSDVLSARDRRPWSDPYSVSQYYRNR